MSRIQSQTLGWLLMGAPPEPDLDWAAVVELARRHGVSPFLFWRLEIEIEGGDRERAGGGIPGKVREALRGDFYAAAARGMVRDRQLAQVLDTLAAADVPVVLLKGAAWARSVYPDPALRLMGDLDLWIPRDRLKDARSALASLGYEARSKEDRPLALQDAFLGETQLTSQEPGTGLLELHWNVFPGEWLRHTARIDEGPVWQRCVPLDETGTRQLAPEDAVLNACLHFAINHQLGGMGLRPLLDLALMREVWAVDWQLVAERAQAWQVCTATWLILDLVASFFGDPEGQLPLQTLQPSLFRERLLRRFVSLQSLVEGQVLPRGPVRRLFLLLLVDRPSDALRLLYRTFVPEREWLTLRYGLEGAPGWRVRWQQVWHPLRVLVRGDV